MISLCIFMESHKCMVMTMQKVDTTRTDFGCCQNLVSEYLTLASVKSWKAVCMIWCDRKRHISLLVHVNKVVLTWYFVKHCNIPLCVCVCFSFEFFCAPFPQLEQMLMTSITNVLSAFSGHGLVRWASLFVHLSWQTQRPVEDSFLYFTHTETQKPQLAMSVQRIVCLFCLWFYCLICVCLSFIVSIYTVEQKLVSFLGQLCFYRETVVE